MRQLHEFGSIDIAMMLKNLRLRADSECDISDNWMEERGDDESVVTAYFHHEPFDHLGTDGRQYVWPELIGIRVERGSIAYEHGPNIAHDLLGSGCVGRIEGAQYEEVNR